jgi:Nuclease-related domain
MQIFHCSPYRNAEGKPRTDVKKEAAKALGANWLEIFQTEDDVIDTLANFLDDDYILFTNIQLLEDGPDADMLLFGPTGVWTMEFIHSDGEYKAEGDTWLRLNTETNDYEPVAGSPIVTARDNAAAVYEYLHSKDLPVPWVNPVFVLTQKNVTAYTENTAIATVRPGEVEQFAQQDIMALDPVMDETDIQQVFQALKPFANAPSSLAEDAAGGPKKLLGMSTAQWVIILALALLNVCVLGGFAWYVLANG